jgi:hypothetical protein
LISETQAFDGSVNENSLFKTLGTIKYLCLELVVTLSFLLNLLLSPSSYMYLATVILDNLVPKEANDDVIRRLQYRYFESK